MIANGSGSAAAATADEARKENGSAAWLGLSARCVAPSVEGN